MNINLKNLGMILVGFSIILVFILSIVKMNLDRENVYLCKLVSEMPGENMEDCPAHKSNSSWMILIGFGIASLILGSGIYLIFFPENLAGGNAQSAKKFRNIEMVKLDEAEKKIYGLLKVHEGSIYQSDMMKETGFSKVRVTRILDRLEQKDIIERKRRGMTNLIVLK